VPGKRGGDRKIARVAPGVGRVLLNLSRRARTGSVHGLLLVPRPYLTDGRAFRRQTRAWTTSFSRFSEAEHYRGCAGSYARDTLFMDRPIAWNYREFHLVGFMLDVVQRVERLPSCCLCSSAANKEEVRDEPAPV